MAEKKKPSQVPRAVSTASWALLKRVNGKALRWWRACRLPSSRGPVGGASRKIPQEPPNSLKPTRRAAPSVRLETPAGLTYRDGRSARFRWEA
jgi:hypothetical protein